MSRLLVVMIFTLVLDGGGGSVPELLASRTAPIVVTDDAVADELGTYLAAAAQASSRDEAIAAMRRGLDLVKKGDASGAVAAFERAAELLPGIGDWARVLGADAAATAGDTATVRRLLSETEPTLARGWGWRARIAAARDADDTAGALAMATALTDSLTEPAQRAELSLTLARIHLERRDTTNARAALRTAIAASPGTMAAIDAARVLSALRGLDADDHLAVGRLYLRHGNRDRGIAGIDAYLMTGRGSAEERARARLDAARALFDGRSYASAERRLTSLATVTDVPAVAAEAMVLLGRTQYRQGKAAARATLLRAAESFPNERAAAEALYIVADLDHDKGDRASARALYRRAMTANPGSDAAGQAAMRLGGLEFAAGRYEEAAAVFDEYRAHHPEGRRSQQAAYWAGRAHTAAGADSLGRARFAEAAALDPADYYGIRAADMLEDAAWHALLATSPTTSEQAALETAGAFTRLDLLDALGLERESAFEMERLKRHFARHEGAFYALAEGFHERGQTFTGIRLGRELQRNEGAWNPRLLRIVFPFPYQDEILRYARQRGVDPYLVAGLIRQESMFNAKARSSAGAIGLMQIMPPTGKSLARRDGVSFQLTKLREPSFNIRLGTLFMADLLGRYDGRLTYVLAAYNAGPTRVARWRSMPEAAEDDLFAERIPFAETRDYVKIVQQNARIYRAVYSE